MDYASLDFQRFPAYRDGFRRLMAEKPLADIRAARSVLYKLKSMTATQIQLLIDDLKLLEDYRTRMATTGMDEFISIMEHNWPKTA